MVRGGKSVAYNDRQHRSTSQASARWADGQVSIAVAAGD